MKITEQILGQALRLFQVSKASSGLYMPDAISGLVDAYGFVGLPDINRYLAGEDKGLIFKHGKFNGSSIDSFEIYNDGILVNTTGTVEYADSFIDEVIDWFLDAFDYTIKDYPPICKNFTSQLEVEMDINLDRWINRVNILTSKINESLENSGIEASPFQVSGFHMHFDTSKYGIGAPSEFKVERRSGVEYDANLYYSSAPIKTADHINILEALEEIAKE